MITIQLSKGNILIDDEDFERVNKYSWHMHGSGYAHAWIEGKKVLLHRFILNFPNSSIDHINHNRLDNRKTNLRLCSPQQNSANIGLTKTNKTGFKGVFWNKTKKKYDAQITINSKSTYIGRFDTPEEAARAYDKKAKEIFGEFAYVNFND